MKNILRNFISITIVKFLIIVCRILNQGGTTLPGKIIQKIHPDILSNISKQFKIIMVTGTNGKTTTTKIISQLLKESNIDFITNKSGANLIGGITTTLIQGVNFWGKNKKSVALLEIDEAVFGKIADKIQPNILVVTNFFRDQLDRYGELYTTLNKVNLGISKLQNATLVLNADDSLCASLGRDFKNVIYYGFDPQSSNNLDNMINTDSSYCILCKNKYAYSYRTYGHLGHFVCTECGYCRPTSNVTCIKVKQLADNYSKIKLAIDINSHKQRTLDIKVNLPGVYNIYNSLAAISVGALLDLPNSIIIKSIGNFESGFGRMETITINDSIIKLVLVKNPAGFDQIINLLKLEKKSFNTAFLLNDKLADGTDISWIWDANLEELQNNQDKIQNVFAAGTRAEDMCVRLKYSGIPADKIKIIKDYKLLISQGLENCKSFYILANYTSMLEIRKFLKKKFKLKEFWK